MSVRVAGLNLIHVIDFSDPSKPELVHHLQINRTGEITDIEVSAFWSVG